MKREIAIFAAIALIVSFMWIATPAIAAETLTFKPSKVELLTDKNGKEYVRMLMPTGGTQNGIAWSDAVAINAFGDHVAAAKQVKPGQEISIIVQKKEHNGKPYYTILGLKGEAQAKKQ